MLELYMLLIVEKYEKKSLNQFDEATLRENVTGAFSPLEEMGHYHSCLFHEFDHYGRE